MITVSKLPLGAIAEIFEISRFEAQQRIDRAHPSVHEGSGPYYTHERCAHCGVRIRHDARHVCRAISHPIGTSPPPERVWCSVACQNADMGWGETKLSGKVALVLTCSRCGKAFTARRKNARFCSRRCNRLGAVANSAKIAPGGEN